MRAIDKSEFKLYFEKGRQHQKVAHWSFKEKDYDAAITNFCIAIINYLDALSVNRFGKDLSSKNHEAAPVALHQQLNGIGISDFKSLSFECVRVLKLKNVASYRSHSLTSSDAKLAQNTTEKAMKYVETKFDRQILPV